MIGKPAGGVEHPERLRMRGTGRILRALRRACPPCTGVPRHRKSVCRPQFPELQRALQEVCGGHRFSPLNPLPAGPPGARTPAGSASPTPPQLEGMANDQQIVGSDRNSLGLECGAPLPVEIGSFARPVVHRHHGQKNIQGLQIAFAAGLGRRPGCRSADPPAPPPRCSPVGVECCSAAD